jgi:hypothetical protein
VPLDFVIVRNVNESKRSPAKTFMPREQAQELYEAGLATWNKKGTALTLKKRDYDMYKPALSLHPNERVMMDFVMGKVHAVAIIDKWKFAA